MFLLIFVAIAIIQWLAYSYFDQKELRFGRMFILLFFLFIYFVVMPYIFYPTPPPEEEDRPRCAMPIMVMYMAFWIVGGGLTLIMHLIYFLIARLRVKKSSDHE